jgi:hypothetical protein
MRKSAKSKSAKPAPTGGDPIAAYSRVQSPAFGTMCNQLRKLIDANIPKATSKVWHGSPVWFLDENPVVGYSTTAKSVNLLFWNGRALEEPSFKPVGKYGAAQAVFSGAGEIDPKLVRRWLVKARTDVFDSKAFFKAQREARK